MYRSLSFIIYIVYRQHSSPNEDYEDLKHYRSGRFSAFYTENHTDNQRTLRALLSFVTAVVNTAVVFYSSRIVRLSKRPSDDRTLYTFNVYVFVFIVSARRRARPVLFKLDHSATAGHRVPITDTWVVHNTR